PWTITGGKHLRAHHGASPPSYVPAGSLVAPGSASSGETRHATVTVLETSVVHLSLSGPGTDLPVTKDRTVEAGSLRLAWTVPRRPHSARAVRTRPGTVKRGGPEPRWYHRPRHGCRLRRLREDPVLRDAGLPFAPPVPAPVRSEHPARAGGGERRAQAAQRVH